MTNTTEPTWDPWDMLKHVTTAPTISTAAITAVGAQAHNTATARGIYPQHPADTLHDILDEADEAEAAYIEWRRSIDDPDTAGAYHHLLVELADVAIVALSALHDLCGDAGRIVAEKMAANETRGPR